MTISSSHSLQTLSDSELFMPMSDGHQPLPGDVDFISWSEEDISNFVAALRSSESSPEVRTQLDALFNDSDKLLLDTNENALLGPTDAHIDGSNHDELPVPQQGTWAGVRYGENAQASFPTSENFTAPVAGFPQLPQIDGNLYYSLQPSVDPQATTQYDVLPQHDYGAEYAMNGPPSAYYTQPSTTPQGPSWFQHEYNPGYHANGPSSAYFLQPSAAVEAAPQSYEWPQLGYHRVPSYSNQQPQTVVGPSYTYQQFQTVAGPSYTYLQPHTVACPLNVNCATAGFPQGQDVPLQMGSGVGSSVQPSSTTLNWTASAEYRKRKYCQTVTSEGGNPTSSATQRSHKRRRPNYDDNREGKFGPYTLADTSATVMAMPVDDPQPVDISNRRTHDPHGNPLRTRRFGVMELDDSSPDASDNVTDHPSPRLTCVRSCDWTDQPCGLFIEMDKAHIKDHLWYWHGVTMKDDTPCQFKDCSDLGPMMHLGRHIESVHFATSYQCPYCKKLFSRTDSLLRHQKGCKLLSASKKHAMHGGYDFHLKEAIESVYGYIVPA